MVVALYQTRCPFARLEHGQLGTRLTAPITVITNITRIIKTFSIKMKEDVGTSKPKKHANKVGRLT